MTGLKAADANMTDSEIVEEAVKQISEWRAKVALEVAQREAALLRKQSMIAEVQRRTGADRFDAARYVEYIMNSKGGP